MEFNYGVHIKLQRKYTKQILVQTTTLHNQCQWNMHEYMSLDIWPARSYLMLKYLLIYFIY